MRIAALALLLALLSAPAFGGDVIKSPTGIQPPIAPSADAVAAPVVPAAPPTAPAVGSPLTGITPPATPVVETPKTPVDVDADPVGTIESIGNAIQSKDWKAAVGAFLMILVWLTRRFLLRSLPKRALPWIAAGLGVVLDVGIGMSNSLPVWKALLSGLLSGASAVAWWEMVFQHIPMLKPKDEDEGDAPAPAADPVPK